MKDETTTELLTVEHQMQVWNNGTGTRIEIGPDRDGLGLVEIRRYDNGGDVTERSAMSVAEWNLLRQYCPD